MYEVLARAEDGDNVCDKYQVRDQVLTCWSRRGSWQTTCKYLPVTRRRTCWSLVLNVAATISLTSLKESRNSDAVTLQNPSFFHERTIAKLGMKVTDTEF